MTGDSQRLRGAQNRLLRGYAPLAVIVVALVAMVAVVPSRVPDDVAAGDQSEATEVESGRPATGWGETVEACEDRSEQVEGFGYSPPCFQFSGDNGGATAPGVTGDTIKVAYRITPDPFILYLLGTFGNIDLGETNQDMARTAEALVEWINQNFELYGRRIELVTYDGRGQMIDEFLGAGQDAATNDSIRVANEIGAFADVTGLTQPYADALARNEVIAIGAPYMSREWFEQRRPYAWSNFPDCTVTAEATSLAANQQVLGYPADYAGPDLADEERTLAVIAPNNVEYQRCVDTFEEGLAAEGNELALRLDYSIDVATMPTQASGLLSRIKSEGITSVSCACDPIMQMYMAQEAEAQNYHPEWLIAGVGFIDLDLGGQIIAANAPEQWQRAFGVSPSAAQDPPDTNVAYQAYRSVRDDEPSQLIDIIFQQLLILALGVQMAGPELTPETFETGLFSYGPGTGTAGTWDFSPGHYTPITDARVLWWDPDAISPFNGAPGTYVDNGERYSQENMPEGQQEVFQ
ncbi:MAG: ABC transporter substrate-binding protein [Acidimicrobiia bacterium]